ncbi:sugar ABC transporter substrate-binding protein [Streptomyces sp. HUAS ZL42]|uniref:sugar ABC transporter substrate-binding protein n=1 Tax=Streptomyces sp. HUAS ZL42 TaxID=3231715 RepID=UPI00345E425B
MLTNRVVRCCRRTAVLAVAGLLALAMSACDAGKAGGDTTSGGASGPSSAAIDDAKAIIEQYSAPVTKFPKVAPVADTTGLAGKSVWYVPISMAPPAFQVYADSLTKALSHLDVHVHVCDGKFVPTAIAACLEQAGSSGADAVVTGYVDYVLASHAVDALVDKGVKVLLGGAALPSGRHNTETLAFHDTIDQQLLGQELTASALIADSGGKANILYIGTSDTRTIQATGDHAVKYLGEKCPDCKVTRINYNSASLDKLPSQVSAALIKEPNTNYIFAVLDTAIPPAIAGARAAGFEKKVKIGGMGGDLAVLQGIAGGGPEFATAGSFLSYTSWLFADDVVRMLAGQAPADKGLPVPYRLFTKADVAGLALTPKGYASMEWYGSDAYEEQFLTAWGAK